ncbi:MAG TPA: sigma-70 family RNA polymerase sigma factor [Kofleriaceae bacterium]|jgi:RNA polymerase sigma-70 factor (ECF subfamily)
MGQASTAARSPRAEIDDLTLRRAQQGERGALGALIDRYHPMVHALVWRMACAQGESHVADLVQDALLGVLTSIARFDPRGPAKLSTWILTIATRVVLNDRRRGPAPDAAGPAAFVDPATSASDKELAVAIARSVAALAEPQRIVLVLREYHDLDYAEIAEALDIDVGTVKSRLSRARTGVRTALELSNPDLFRGDR